MDLTLPVSNLEMRVQRIELRRQRIAPKDRRLDWHVQVHIGKAADHVMLIGRLFGAVEEGTGQILATAYVAPDAEKTSWADWATVKPWAETSGSETLYVFCRRALESQAAQMDYSFDFSPTAPPVEAHLDEHGSNQADTEASK